MKKIGILTFHRAANYGAVLQCYALQKKVAELGADCEVIDYVCNKIERNYNPELRHNEKLYVKVYKWLYGVRTAQARYNAFQDFIKKNLKLSEKEYFSDNIAESRDFYDKVIVGSDQVWNREITGNDAAYFLDYIDDDKKKYSYAASAGDIKAESAETKYIREKVTHFSGVSIREKDIKEALSVEKSQTHVDPVFLLSSDAWREVAVNNVPEKYILVYSVRENWKLVRMAQEYAKSKNLKFVYVYSHFNLKEVPKVIRERCHSIIRYETARPEEFVGLIKDAECIFTNSFHGTAFSIIFHKNFWADAKSSEGKINRRLEEVLNKFNLSKCMLNNSDYVPEAEKVDWDMVETIIKQERSLAETYLKNIVEN